MATLPVTGWVNSRSVSRRDSLIWSRNPPGRLLQILEERNTGLRGDRDGFYSKSSNRASAAALSWLRILFVLQVRTVGYCYSHSPHRLTVESVSGQGVPMRPVNRLETRLLVTVRAVAAAPSRSASVQTSTGTHRVPPPHGRSTDRFSDTLKSSLISVNIRPYWGANRGSSPHFGLRIDFDFTRAN